MIYNLYCANHRDYAPHSVIDDEKGEIQTIKCLFCEHKQQHVILDRRVSVSKSIYDQYQEEQERLNEGLS